jgi:cytochrome c oxidase subunit 2
VHSRKKSLLSLCATSVGIVLGASACAPLSPTEQGSSVRHLYNAFSWIALAVFVIVIALIGWSIVRYRAKENDDPQSIPPQIKKNIPLEITYFAIPQLIVVGMFIASIFVLHDVNKTPAQVNGEKPLVVRVTGFQWGWDFTYRGSDVTVESIPHDIATFYLPTDTPIRFEIRSKDVVHSFFVPKFLMKRDAIPGINNDFQIDGIRKAGTSQMRCAEFCGLLHDEMYAYIKAVPPPQFQSWLDKQQQGE